MNTYQVFRAGNSDVVALNPAFKDQHGLKPGVKVVQENTPEGILIKPAKRQVKVALAKQSRSDAEFKKWWQMFVKENGGILDDLA